MNKFQIKSFRGGISEYNDRGISGSFQSGYNLLIDEKEDLIKLNYDFSSIGSVSDLILWLVPSITGKIYGFGSSGKIYEINGSSVSLKYIDSNGRIKGACEWYINNGKSYLFWANDTYLNSKEIPGQSDWSDVNASIGGQTFPKTNLTNADWHTMKVVMGQLLISNKNTLALVGYDASYTNEALNIFKSNEIYSLTKRPNSVVFGTKKVNNDGIASLFSWDTISTTWNSEKELPFSPVYGLIETDIPLAFVGDGYLFYTDMVNNIPILRIKGGGVINPGGVSSIDGVALFGVFGNDNNLNGIYSYGRKFKNDNHILNLKYKIDNCDEIGAVLNFGGTIYFSYKSGSNYYLMKSNSNYCSVGYYRSLKLIPDLRMLKDYLWNNVVVYTKPLPAGTSIKVYYSINGSDFKLANCNSGSSFNISGATVGYFNIGEQGKEIEIAVELYSDSSKIYSPEIKMIEVYFG